MMIIVHLICPICYYDLAEWAGLRGMDCSVAECFSCWDGDALHVYRLRPIKSRKCDYEEHMYLVNAR